MLLLKKLQQISNTKVSLSVRSIFGFLLPRISKRLVRQILYQVLSVGMLLCFALMIWKGLMILTHNKTPIVALTSSSMEPAFHRGDMLFLTNYPEEPVRVGDIVVFKLKGHNMPIVHRVIKVHQRNNLTVKFLTKGDNNKSDDKWLYAPGQLWLKKKDMIGTVRGFLPYVGMIKIWIEIEEDPMFKYSLLMWLVLFLLFYKE